MTRYEQFLWGFLAGLVLMTLPLWWVQHRSIEVMELQQSVMAHIQKNADDCLALYNEKISSATLLVETSREEKLQPIDVLGGLVRLAPGSAIGGGTQENTITRWYIPAKVKPILYGPRAGMSYLYYTPGTGKVEGPFVPEAPRP